MVSYIPSRSPESLERPTENDSGSVQRSVNSVSTLRAVPGQQGSQRSEIRSSSEVSRQKQRVFETCYIQLSQDGIKQRTEERNGKRENCLQEVDQPFVIRDEGQCLSSSGLFGSSNKTEHISKYVHYPDKQTEIQAHVTLLVSTSTP